MMFVIREVVSGQEWWVGADSLQTACELANDLPKSGTYEIRQDEE